MKSQAQQDAWGEDLQLPPSHGFLKHDILERICLFLPNQQDCYQACFINQAWSTAATKVLWESPVFRIPSKFTTFVRVIEREKRLAIQVKNLTLCLPDTPSNTLFDPVSRSEQDRHMMKGKMLSRPHVIRHLAEHCQQLVSLTIYGWNLGQRDFDDLYSTLPLLKNLKVIGTNDEFKEHSKQCQQSQLSSIFQLNTYLPRLSQLTLDGLFPISKSFAHSISVKAQNLTSLHLSLYSMNLSILQTLCTNDTALDLRELTLTHGTHMNDVIVDNVLRRFSKLRLFCLEGSEHVTANVLRIAMENCPRLQHLEIRQAVMGKPMLEGLEQEDWQLMVVDTDVRTLLVENVWLYDNTLDNIAYYCPILTNLGICHGGSDLTDIGIEALVRASLTFLRHVKLLYCPRVTSKALTYLPMPSLYSLYLESNGAIEPIDIFDVCSRAVAHANEQNLRPNLRQVCLVGYKNIANSVVGSHAIERLGYQAKQWVDGFSIDEELQATDYRITLDQHSIDALARSDKFVSVPPTRVLTSHQIMELARRLQMPLNQFIQLLDELEELEPVAAPVNPEPVQERVSEVPVSRVDQLRNSTAQRLRPSTPALWAESINDYDSLPSRRQSARPPSYDSLDNIPTPLSPPPQESNSDSSASDSMSSRSQSRPSDSNSDQESQASNDKEEWPGLQSSSGAHISLGGWGTSDLSPWSKRKSTPPTNAQDGPLLESRSNRVRSHSNFNNNSNTSNNNNNISSSSNSNDYSNSTMNWVMDSNDNLEAHWQVQTMDGPPPKKKGQLTNLDMEADKWGSPNQVVAWSETEPYVADVLKSQSSTTYWQNNNGSWEQLQANDVTSTSNTRTTGKGNSNSRSSYGNERKFNRFSASTPQPSSSVNRTVPVNSITYPDDDQVIFSNASGKYGNRNITNYNYITTNNNNENNTNAYHLSSDDSDVDWDDDDGITIKIGKMGVTQQSRYSPVANREVNGPTYNAKANGREPRQGKFARPKAPAPVAAQAPSSPPTYTLSFTQPKDPQSDITTNSWREFADNVKVNKETTVTTTTAASLLSSSPSSPTTSTYPSPRMTALMKQSTTNFSDVMEKENSVTEMLVDTSDNTTFAETTNWNNHEERNVLHDLYNSMSNLDLNNKSSNNTSTIEQECIVWNDDDANSKDTGQDDRGTIRVGSTSIVSTDDTLLLFNSAPSPVPQLDGNNDDNDGSHLMEEHSLIDSSTDTPTPPLEPQNALPSMNSASSDTFSTLDMLLGDSPKTTTAATATAATATTTATTTTTTTTTVATVATVATADYNGEVIIGNADASTSGTSNADTVNSADDDPTTATRTANGDDIFLRLSLNTPNGIKVLLLSEDKNNVEREVHQFCTENDVLDREEAVFNVANKSHMEKTANMVLGPKKKNKKKKKDKESRKKQVAAPAS